MQLQLFINEAKSESFFIFIHQQWNGKYSLQEATLNILLEHKQAWILNIYRNTFTGVLKSKTIHGLEWRVLILLYDTGEFRKHLISHFLLPPLCWWTSRHGFEKLSHQVWIGLELVHLQLNCFFLKKLQQVYLFNKKRKCRNCTSTYIFTWSTNSSLCSTTNLTAASFSSAALCRSANTLKSVKTSIWLRKLPCPLCLT